MTDLQRLAAACRAQPDEDTPRLLLADALQESPEMQCPHCEGSGKWFPPRPLSTRAASNSDCYTCKGTGTVIDPTREEWAELCRVQCELAKYDDSTPNCNRYADQMGCDCGECTRYYTNAPIARPLRRRESTLLAALARCCPKCPACDDESGYRVHCTFCEGGSVGRFPLTWHRGGASCKVPRLEDVWESVDVPVYHQPSNIFCPHCKSGKLVERQDSKNALGGVYPKWCPQCMAMLLPEQRGSQTEWQPTPLGRELAALPLLVAVECVDRVPVGPLIYRDKDSWLWNDWEQVRQPNGLPSPVFDLLRGGEVYARRLDGKPASRLYFALEAARAALAAAVAESLCEWSQC